MVEKANLQTALTPEFTAQVNGSFRYDSEILFADIEFNIPKGVWTCLLGSSGSGKSTLLRLIAGLNTDGQFDGEMGSAIGSEFSEHVSFMAQSDLLFPWLSVRQNVSLGHRLRNRPIDENQVTRLIERIGLSEHTNKRPSQLSGGMRQRAALARTLMEDTPIVLLDEPFSALDSKTRSEMQKLAFRVLRGKTVLLVTHDISEAILLGSHVYLLKDQGLQVFEMTKDLNNEPPVRSSALDCVIDAQTQLLRMMNQ